MWTTLMRELLRCYLVLAARADRLTGAVGHALTMRTGQSSVEWALITAGLAVGLAAVMTVLTGALNEYFTALADWLRLRKPV